MAVALVQRTSATSAFATSLPKAYASNNTAGSLLVAVGAVPDAGGGTPTITDSKGQSWTVVNTLDGGSGFNFTFGYFPNCAAGANTVTLNEGGVAVSDWSLSIYEFSGVATSTVVDHSDSTTAYFPASTNPTTTAFTASANGYLYVGALITRTANSITKDSAWSQGEAPVSYRADEYLIQSTAANLAADWTITSDRGSWYIYVFKAAAGGAATVVRRSLSELGTRAGSRGVQNA